MTYLIEQRDDDRLAFTLMDPEFDGNRPDPNLRAYWAAMQPETGDEVVTYKDAIRRMFADSYEQHFLESEAGEWLADILSPFDYELDGRECLEYGPLILRFKRPDHASLFKLVFA